MSAIQPSDILVRVTAKPRYGVMTRRLTGIARGGEQLQETFARSTVGAFRDITGVGRKAGVNKPRLEWYDLNGDGIYETPAILLEGARTQLVTDPENFGAWTASNTGSRTAAQADPFGGTAAYLLNDTDAVNPYQLNELVTFTADGEKCLAVFIKQGTGVNAWFGLFDTTAAAWRRQVRITWSAGVPSLTSIGGTGTLYAPVAWGGGWWLCAASAIGVIAANANNFYVSPADNAGAGTGTSSFFGANAWNAVFPSSYQGPSGGASPSGADSLTVPLPFGVQDLTVFASLVRPVWAGITTLVGGPCLASIGAAPGAGQVRLLFDRIPSSASFEGYIDTPTTDVNITGAIPVGASLAAIAQFRNLTTGGSVNVDPGTGLVGFSGAATPATAFGAQTLYVGSRPEAGNELFGGLIDLFVVKGLHTLAECQAVP